MDTKTTKKPQEGELDVNSLIEKAPEDKPIKSAELSTEVAPEAIVVAPIQSGPVEERLREDLKMSYPAKGILDITAGGYGFLRHDYAINPDKDIYISTSQIRRFWLRRGDEVEGLARPPKEGERFHSLLLIKKINGEEMNEQT